MLDTLIVWLDKWLVRLATLWAVYLAGQAKQRARDTSKQLDIREKQIEVIQDAPTNKAELLDRLRKGGL